MKNRLLLAALLFNVAAYAADNTKVIQAGVGWNICQPESDPKCQRFNAQERRAREYDRDRERDREDRRLRDTERDMRERTERDYGTR